MMSFIVETTDSLEANDENGLQSFDSSRRLFEFPSEFESSCPARFSCLFLWTDKTLHIPDFHRHSCNKMRLTVVVG